MTHECIMSMDSTSPSSPPQQGQTIPQNPPTPTPANFVQPSLAAIQASPADSQANLLATPFPVPTLSPEAWFRLHQINPVTSLVSLQANQPPTPKASPNQVKTPMAPPESTKKRGRPQKASAAPPSQKKPQKNPNQFHHLNLLLLLKLKMELYTNLKMILKTMRKGTQIPTSPKNAGFPLPVMANPTWMLWPNDAVYSRTTTHGAQKSRLLFVIGWLLSLNKWVMRPDQVESVKKKSKNLELCFRKLMVSKRQLARGTIQKNSSTSQCQRTRSTISNWL
ncbi:hypothetical protein DFH28DRAFT_923940 [Melampsora americana]|nr:hypothetical protein DFH28DRAFT_923940 [Melampsora americana]